MVKTQLQQYPLRVLVFCHNFLYLGLSHLNISKSCLDRILPKSELLCFQLSPTLGVISPKSVGGQFA